MLASIHERLDELELPLDAEPELALGLVRLHQRKERGSLEGLLLGVTAGHYRLTNAKLLVDTNREHDVKLDGEVYVPCGDVLYVQKVG